MGVLKPTTCAGQPFIIALTILACTALAAPTTDPNMRRSTPGGWIDLDVKACNDNFDACIRSASAAITRNLTKKIEAHRMCGVTRDACLPTKHPTKTPTKDPTKTPTQDPTKTPTQDPTKTPPQDPTKPQICRTCEDVVPEEQCIDWQKRMAVLCPMTSGLCPL